MNGLPYYKAYPRDFIEGTIGMDFETKAAYRLVLDLIYMQGGNLPDDARYISGLLGCTVKKWNSLRDKLIAAGKIVVRGNHLANYRADKELETLGKLQDKQRENRSRPNKNKALESPRFDHTEPEPDTETSTTSMPPAVVAPAVAEQSNDGLTRREQVLTLMGLDTTGITPAGSFTGTTNDQAELPKWDALGLSRAEQDGVIRDMLAKQRRKSPHFVPNRWSWFTAGMRDLADGKRAQPSQPAEASLETRRAERRKKWASF